MKLILVATLAMLLAGCAVTTTDTPPVPATAGTTVTPTAAAPTEVSSTAPTTEAPSAAPSSAAGGIGVPVQVGDWTITVNSVTRTKSGNQFIKPDAGNVFWVADITVVNGTTDNQLAGSGIKLIDDKDFAHDAEFLGIKKPELTGNLAAGAKLRGYITYQMATGAKPAAITFQPDLFDASNLVTIKL
jgi:hypothetical protein